MDTVMSWLGIPVVELIVYYSDNNTRIRLSRTCKLFRIMLQNMLRDKLAAAGVYEILMRQDYLTMTEAYEHDKIEILVALQDNMFHCRDPRFQRLIHLIATDSHYGTMTSGTIWDVLRRLRNAEQVLDAHMILYGRILPMMAYMCILYKNPESLKKILRKLCEQFALPHAASSIAILNEALQSRDPIYMKYIIENGYLISQSLTLVPREHIILYCVRTRIMQSAVRYIREYYNFRGIRMPINWEFLKLNQNDLSILYDCWNRPEIQTKYVYLPNSDAT